MVAMLFQTSEKEDRVQMENKKKMKNFFFFKILLFHDHCLFEQIKETHTTAKNQTK